MRYRRGFFFTTDVMLCIIVLVIGFVLVWSSFTEEPPKEQPYFLAEDVSSIMATTTNADVLDKIMSLVEDGSVVNFEYTLFEQIGDFYVQGKYDIAFQYTKRLAENILPPQYSIAILFENYTIYNQTRTVSQNQSAFLLSSKRMVVIVSNASELLGPYTGEVRVW
ncbi:hypothetical protein HY488_02810 [Candidatus Woesearchaeota archaeon]|nr:hypothetical protein [Candidatus Woesearchaeota archaeon]